jgi:hypothetical protein
MPPWTWGSVSSAKRPATIKTSSKSESLLLAAKLEPNRWQSQPIRLVTSTRSSKQRLEIKEPIHAYLRLYDKV